MFNSEAKFGQYLFQGCINLAKFTLVSFHPLRGSALQARTGEFAPGCLSSAGITALALTKHFAAIGPHACDSCRLLKSVDLCNTNVEEIPEFTFVHCTSLREVLLPTTLHTIRVKAFMNCAALVELAIPPSLRYIGSGAFPDCTVFRRLVKMPGRHKWRGVYAEENAFRHLSCYEMATLATYDPGWGIPLVLDENKPSWPQLSRSHSHSLRVWARALARVQGRPEAKPGQIP